MMNKKTLYIVTGHPGAGKTFRANELMEKKGITKHFEADMWMNDEQGNYKFDAKKLGYCHKKCYQSVRQAMIEGYDVIQSNTNLVKKHVKPYINLAEDFGYQVVIEHLFGNFQNVHGVPKEKVEIMKEKREIFSFKDFQESELQPNVF